MNLKQGEAYLVEAENALNRFTLFGFGKQQKLEDAALSFKNAGHQFNLAGSFDRAAAAFMKCVQVLEQLPEPDDSDVDILVKAATCYKMANNPTDAVKVLKRVIQIVSAKGQVGARYWKEIAETVEGGPETIDAYETAARMFELENKPSQSNACLIKVAELSMDNPKKAADIFEKIGKYCMSTTLGQFSAKNYLLQALICFLAIGNKVQVANKLEEYRNVDYSFAASREHDFIQALLQVSSFSFFCGIFFLPNRVRRR